MPWTVGTFHKKRWYHSPWPWIGAALTASALFLILPHAQSFYVRWTEARRIERANEAFARGDYKDAILRSRMVLQRNIQSIPATRVYARALEALGSPEALTARQHLESIGGNDAENSLAIAAAMWAAANDEGAERALAETPADGRETAKFHELSARVAVHRNDYAAATEHWRRAVQLAPANSEYALEYSSAQLKVHDDRQRTEAQARLAALREKPETRLQALRILVSDAVIRGESSPSLEFAKDLVETPGATFIDKLRRLTVLQNRRRNEAGEYLAALQKEAIAEPRNVFLLLTWMNENDLALAIPEWGDQLPPESIDLPQIRAALADADARASNWPKLKEKLEAANWRELEFLRYAYLARATERLGDELGSTAAWNNALSAAQMQPRNLEILARTVLGWGWTQKGDSVLWKLTETGKAPRWAADRLWESAAATSNTAQLYQAARAIATLDPRSVSARNNYIALALLTGNQADSPHKLAATLYQQAPTDPVVCTTYGFSLFQQGRANEAVTVMKTLPMEKLRQPNIALYHAIFLTGAGHLAEAREYLQYAARAPMLPEEQALFFQAGGTQTSAK